MSNLYGRAPAMAGAIRSEQRGSSRGPFLLARGTIRAKPATGVPAFYPGGLVRPALQSSALYFLVIVMAMMSMVKPAQAAGTVSFLNCCSKCGSGVPVIGRRSWLSLPLPLC